MEQIPMTYDGRTVGTAEFRRDGLYCLVECRCEPVSDAVLRAYAQGDGRNVALGVLIPEDGALLLRRRIPASHLPAEEEITQVTISGGTGQPASEPEPVPSEAPVEEPPEPAAESESAGAETTDAAPDAPEEAASPAAEEEAAPGEYQWKSWTGTVGGILVEDGRIGTADGRTVMALPFAPDRPLPDPELLRRCQPMEMEGRMWLMLELPREG